MRQLDEIRNLVGEDFRAYQGQFRAMIKTPVPLLSIVLQYLVSRKGKQVRPLFVLLSAAVSGGITARSHRAATLIELLHTATLLHDDVVDDSYQRRGGFTINALWKNKVSVLAGDYLLSRGLLLSLDNDDCHLLKIASQATQQMSEGELLQIERARKLDMDEPAYLEIIRKKTASLIAACCAIGAASAGAPEHNIEKMRLVGEKIGMAFQIKDDLLDYEKTNALGKPTAADLKEKKITLPMIYTLNQADSKTKKRIIRTIKRHNNNPEKIRELIEIVRNNGGMEYAVRKMEKLKDEAKELLGDFPPSAELQALKKLVDFTIERKK